MRPGAPAPGPPRARPAPGSTPSSTAAAHGCPILPGEDPEAYQHRLDAWVDKFGPRDAVEHYLVERAVHVSWQLDRADRAEAARLADEIAAEAAQLAEDVATLGAELFRHPAGPDRRRPRPTTMGRADAPLLAVRPGASPATRPGWSPPWRPPRWAATGCGGSGPSWGRSSTQGRKWKPTDRLRAIRLMGQQPLDVVADDQVMSIYLACHAMDPGGPDVFAEPLGDLRRPEMEASRERQAARFAAARAERAPRNPADGRAALRAIVAAGLARAETLREVRAAAEAAEHGGHRGAAVVRGQGTVEWLHKHQVTCSRALFRTFDEFRKVRRDSDDILPAADETAEVAAPSSGIDAAPGPHR